MTEPSVAAILQAHDRHVAALHEHHRHVHDRAKHHYAQAEAEQSGQTPGAADRVPGGPADV